MIDGITDRRLSHQQFAERVVFGEKASDGRSQSEEAIESLVAGVEWGDFRDLVRQESSQLCLAERQHSLDMLESLGVWRVPGRCRQCRVIGNGPNILNRILVVVGHPLDERAR